MIRFWSFKYDLQPVTKVSAIADDKPRQGALMKMLWPDRKVGFADIFPWPELGDEPIDRQLNLLSRGRLTPLMEQSIWLARSDAIARSAGKSLMQDIGKVRNHFLVTDYTKLTDKSLAEIRQAGYSTIKFKFGRDLKEEIIWLGKMLKQHPFMVRLDFNTKGDFSAIEKMYGFLGQTLAARVEFIEDPLPWDRLNWEQLGKMFRLAADQVYDDIDWKNLSSPPFQVVVLKPVRQDVDKVVKMVKAHNLKLVVTSSMDHPVGIAHAIRIGAELKNQLGAAVLDGGCISHRVYKPNIFSLSMISKGAHLLPILGNGIGFDSLLNGVEWNSITMK